MKNRFYQLLYIAYYTLYNQNVLLCVSTDIHKVKFYLHNIRGLIKEEYEIKEVPVDSDYMESLYGDYVLEEYIEPYDYLTRVDIENLSKEINTSMEEWNELLERLNAYTNMINKIPKLSESVTSLINAKREIEFHLGKVKNLRRMSKEVIRESPVVSKDINVYFRHVKTIEEDKELVNLFYHSVYDDD